MQKLAALRGPALLFLNNSHVARFEQEFVVSAGQWCSVLNAAIRCTRRSYTLAIWFPGAMNYIVKLVRQLKKACMKKCLMDSDIHPST